MLAVQIVLIVELALVISGVAWMLIGIRSGVRIAGARRVRHQLLEPTTRLLAVATLSLGVGWVISRQGVSSLASLGILGVLLPATAGMALALLLRQEELPTRGIRAWLVLAVPIIGGGTAGLWPGMF
ncbi:hypothetical protein [Streptomyces sp. NPDC087300]|uniref:hypothetical protein n=1 Tax=Streptomyces sp. NPDC087300 TaxID=3365780 RepID=UPI003829C32D